MGQKLGVLMIFVFVNLVTGCGPGRRVTRVDRVVVYEHFVPGSSTNGVKNQFYNPHNGVDTSESKRVMLNPQELDEALKKARTIRHFQQKIAGIAFAGKFYDSSERVHYFIYLKTQKAIIDMSDMTTYQLTDTLRTIEVKGR